MIIDIPDNSFEVIKKEMNWLFFDKSNSDVVLQLINDRLIRESIEGFEIDPLTQTKHFHAFTKMVMNKKMRKGRIFYIFNVKGMKKYNDINGFPSGDIFLKDAVKELKKIVDADIFRIGGDRFYSEINLKKTQILELLHGFEIIKMKTQIDFDECFMTYLHGETVIDLILNASLGKRNNYFSIVKRYKEES